jgi:hypothetical protein
MARPMTLTTVRAACGSPSGLVGRTDRGAGRGARKPKLSATGLPRRRVCHPAHVRLYNTREIEHGVDGLSRVPDAKPLIGPPAGRRLTSLHFRPFDRHASGGVPPPTARQRPIHAKQRPRASARRQGRPPCHPSFGVNANELGEANGATHHVRATRAEASDPLRVWLRISPPTGPGQGCLSLGWPRAFIESLCWIGGVRCMVASNFAAGRPATGIGRAHAGL